MQCTSENIIVSWISILGDERKLRFGLRLRENWTSELTDIDQAELFVLEFFVRCDLSIHPHLWTRILKPTILSDSSSDSDIHSSVMVHLSYVSHISLAKLLGGKGLGQTKGSSIYEKWLFLMLYFRGFKANYFSQSLQNHAKETGTLKA